MGMAKRAHSSRTHAAAFSRITGWAAQSALDHPAKAQSSADTAHGLASPWVQALLAGATYSPITPGVESMPTWLETPDDELAK